MRTRFIRSERISSQGGGPHWKKCSPTSQFPGHRDGNDRERRTKMAKQRGEFWNEEMATLSPQGFHDVQEKALLKQLKYVWKNSVFYQNKFAEAGVTLKDVRTLEDLSKLPFTEKSELRESQLATPPLGTHIACPMSKVKRIYSTSGTTGRPTFIGVTKHDIAVWKEACCRAIWCGGFREGSIIPHVVSPFFIAAS